MIYSISLQLLLVPLIIAGPPALADNKCCSDSTFTTFIVAF